MEGSLPVIKIGSEEYHLDSGLRQLTNIRNPHDSIELTDGETLQLEYKARVEYESVMV